MASWWKKILGGPKRQPPEKQAPPEYPVIEDSPWGVPVLDIQSLTQTVTSVSEDPTCASNALSYRGDEAAEFAAQRIEPDTAIPGELRLPIEGPLQDGVIQAPSQMEDKWALYMHERRILFVRSWTRQVVLDASVRVEGDWAVVGTMRGAVPGYEDPSVARRAGEYLLRDYGLGEGLPTPLPNPYASDPNAAALFAFSVFGRQARFATHLPATLQEPTRPLCCHTLLHIGVARKDDAMVDSALAGGIDVQARGVDGQTALHWAVGNLSMTERLVTAGLPVDSPSRTGTTSLMLATQERRGDAVAQLLAMGASVAARDNRGFASLHRAAEMGEAGIVVQLLDAGAPPDPVSDGHSPLSLAKAAGHAEIVGLLRAAGAPDRDAPT